MTCITAVVKDGHVYMAGDLMGSNGYTKKVYPDTKVFKNGDFIMGFTSSFRLGQILQYNWQQPPRMEGMTDREYIQLDVIESFRSCLNDFGFGEMKEEGHHGGNWLLGYKGCLYEMQDNFSVLKNEDFCSVGSGGFHAEAALALLTEDDDFDPEFVLSKAISIASRFTTSVSEEYTFVTDNDDYVAVPEDLLVNIDTEQDIELLKLVADSMQIKYPHNIGIEALRGKISTAMDELPEGNVDTEE